MLERFLSQTTFTSQDDFIQNFHVKVQWVYGIDVRNMFFCRQIIYENTYEKKISCCFIDLYILSHGLGSTRLCLEIGTEYEGGV